MHRFSGVGHFAFSWLARVLSGSLYYLGKVIPHDSLVTAQFWFVGLGLLC